MEQKEFRKPPRYMVGDIVYSHGFICVVCSVYPFNIDYSYDLKVISGKSLGKICQEDIMHVHIWEEFLKKNGWICYRSEGGSLGLITLIISEENIFINGVGCNSERTMRGFTFADGTPFGILEED